MRKAILILIVSTGLLSCLQKKSTSELNQIDSTQDKNVTVLLGTPTVPRFR